MPHVPPWLRLDSLVPGVPWCHDAKRIWRRFLWILLYSQTSATRFWFALGSLGFSTYIHNSTDFSYGINEFELMEYIAPQWMWSLAFAFHGLATLYGIFTRKYTLWLLQIDGVLGALLWCSASIAMAFSLGTIGASTVMGILSFWLMVRYPARSEYPHAR